ncbi:hypothetical protein CVS40_10847 [Lucilia cuprina]|nr:hypothetical protein CVS40_10847 [Lucilia cuprina]
MFEEFQDFFQKFKERLLDINAETQQPHSPIRICHNCLNVGHFSRRSTAPFQTCQQKHHTIVHNEFTTSASTANIRLIDQIQQRIFPILNNITVVHSQNLKFC